MTWMSTYRPWSGGDAVLTGISVRGCGGIEGNFRRLETTFGGWSPVGCCRVAAIDFLADEFVAFFAFVRDVGGWRECDGELAVDWNWRVAAGTFCKNVNQIVSMFSVQSSFVGKKLIGRITWTKNCDRFYISSIYSGPPARDVDDDFGLKFSLVCLGTIIKPFASCANEMGAFETLDVYRNDDCVCS